MKKRASTPELARELIGPVRATTIAFAALGVASASWAARIPQVKAQLHLSNATLGIVLIAIAAGSMLTLPAAGSFVNRFGAERMVSTGSLLVAGGLAVAAIGSTVSVLLVFAGLLVDGIGIGLWDVAMNVHGATIERHSGRSMLPRFHAWFSIGTVAGALLGVLMVATRVPVPVHVVAIAALVALSVPVAVRRFVPTARSAAAELAGPDAERSATLAPDAVPGSASGGPHAQAAGRPRSAWRTRRALLIGAFVLPFAWAEGAGSDWIGVGMIEGHHSAAAMGTAAYGVFLAAMTAGRWQGHVLLDRYGRVPVLRSLGVLTSAGLLAFVFAPSIPLAFAAVALWGVGTSLGFPVGTSAAADDPGLAASAVSVAASIGYLGFLGGPPVIGLLAKSSGLLHALAVVALAVLVAVLGAGVLREPTRL